MSSLYEFSRPYAGEYECETLTLAGEDMLSSFEYVRLALSYGGQARFFWRSAQGGEGEYTLDYSCRRAGRVHRLLRAHARRGGAYLPP